MSNERRSARRRSILIAAVVLAFLLASGVAFSGSCKQLGHVLAFAQAGGSSVHGDSLSISGSVGGLFPGASKELVITVTNEMSFAIVVRGLSTTVGDASPTCRAANLFVGGFTGSRRVPARGAATITVPITMSHEAGDSCQGAHFPLHYSATATAAGHDGL